MKSILFALALALSLTVLRAEIKFATLEQAREVLGKRDEFIERLSPFDRAARAKSSQPVSEADFLKVVVANVLEFSADEKKTVETALASLGPKIEKLGLKWPAEILIVKTTGKEEGNAPYTRGNTIVLPAGKLAPGAPLERTLCHELFHILSRHDPELRDQLYAVIGFQRCQEVRLPKSRMWITNPDAPKNEHFIVLKRGSTDVAAVPVLLAEPSAYDASKGGEFFAYLKFKFLVVEKDGPQRVRFDEQNPSFVDPAEVTNFFEQIGRNTQYIIHPEEILADNFVLLVNGVMEAKSPEILAKLRAVLEKR